MALKLKNPTARTFVLWELDPSGEAQVTFRQATIRDCQVRDTLVFSQQSRIIAVDGIHVTNSMAWSVRQEIEVRLTITGCVGILRPDGEPLFKFRNGQLAMSEDAFHEAWGMIYPQEIAETLHGCCLDTNPDWDYRDNPVSVPFEGESEEEVPPPPEESKSG